MLDPSKHARRTSSVSAHSERARSNNSHKVSVNQPDTRMCPTPSTRIARLPYNNLGTAHVSQCRAKQMEPVSDELFAKRLGHSENQYSPLTRQNVRDGTRNKSSKSARQCSKNSDNGSENWTRQHSMVSEHYSSPDSETSISVASEAAVSRRQRRGHSLSVDQQRLHDAFHHLHSPSHIDQEVRTAPRSHSSASHGNQKQMSSSHSSTNTGHETEHRHGPHLVRIGHETEHRHGPHLVRRMSSATQLRTKRPQRKRSSSLRSLSKVCSPSDHHLSSSGRRTGAYSDEGVKSMRSSITSSAVRPVLYTQNCSANLQADRLISTDMDSKAKDPIQIVPAPGSHASATGIHISLGSEDCSHTSRDVTRQSSYHTLSRSGTPHVGHSHTSSNAIQQSSSIITSGSGMSRAVTMPVPSNPARTINPLIAYEKHAACRSVVKPSLPTSQYTRIEHVSDKGVCLHILSSLLVFIFSILLFCPVMAVVLFVFPICVFVRKLVQYFCCCCMCEANSNNQVTSCCCVEPATHTDMVWLTQDSCNPPIVQCLMSVDCGLEEEQIHDLVTSRLIFPEHRTGGFLYPRFQQRLLPVKGGYAWIKDNEFLPGNHFFALPKGISNRDELQEYVSMMASKPLSFTKPLWELHLLTHFGDAHDTILLFRMHPCLTDGISLISILFKSVVDNFAICRLKPRIGSSLFAFNAIRSLFCAPMYFAQKWLLDSPDVNLLHGSHVHLSGQKVVAWSEPYDMKNALRLKQISRSTLNDVFVSVAAGILRVYLQENGTNHPFDMRAIIPVDMRADEAQVVMGNEYSFVNITLPTNTEGAIPRLWATRQNMNSIKGPSYYVLMRGLSWMWHSVLPLSPWLNLMGVYFRKATCLLSSLPGPESRLMLCARDINSMVYWLPTRDDIAVGISFLTYDEKVQIGVVADKSVMPNPEVLTENFIKSMNDIGVLISNRCIPGEQIRQRLNTLHIQQERLHSPTLQQVYVRISAIQNELEALRSEAPQPDHSTWVLSGNQLRRLDPETPGKGLAMDDREEILRAEYRGLLSELRHKRYSNSTSFPSDEVEVEYAARRSERRWRRGSVISQASNVSVSSTARPLTTAISLEDFTNQVYPTEMSDHQKRHTIAETGEKESQSGLSTYDCPV